MSIKEVANNTQFDKVEFIKSIDYDELYRIGDGELYWDTFMKHCEVLGTLTLEEFECLYPDLEDEEESLDSTGEPTSSAIVLYNGSTEDMGSFDRKWLR